MGLSMPKASQNPRTSSPPLGEVPCGNIVTGTPYVSPLIEIDHLGNVGQRGKGRLVDRVVKARATVQQKQGRFRLHGRSVRHEAGTFNVEVELGAVHFDKHGPLNPVRTAATLTQLQGESTRR